MPSEKFIDRWQAHLHRAPEADAVYWRRRPVSYRTLDGLAQEARGQLDTMLPGPVCIPAIKSPQTLALVLGCWLSARPVLLPSPDLAEGLLFALARQAGCRSLIVPPMSRAANERMVIKELGDATTSPKPPAPRPDLDTRLLLTTSGSTGMPKIVPLSATGVDAFHVWVADQFSFAPGTTVLSYAPLSFDLSLLDVWAALAAGATTALVDAADAADGTKLGETITASGATVIQAVPLLYQLLADAVRPSTAFPAVMHVIVTGDAVPAPLRGALPKLFPQARFFNVYGCTETNNSTLYEVPTAAFTHRKPLPIGWPIAGVRVLLEDGDGHIIDGAGVGHLLVSTPFQSRGYLEPSLTRDHFVADPTGASDEPYFRSGDIVRRDAQGLLRLIGRNDLQVKVRGVRTNIAEVEHVLAQNPQVRDAGVVAVPDPRAGRRLHAVVRRAPGSALTTLTLRAHCRQLLPRTALPSTIHLTDYALPTTPTGKLDRTELRRLVTDGQA